MEGSKPAPVTEFDQWLAELVAGEGSDLHVKVGAPPMIRMPEGLKRLERDPLTTMETMAIAESIILDDRKDSRLVTYDDLFLRWEKMLRFQVRGRDREQG